MTTQPIVIQSNSQSSGAGKYKINLNAQHPAFLCVKQRINIMIVVEHSTYELLGMFKLHDETKNCQFNGQFGKYKRS